MIERQRREIEALRAQLALLEETGMAIRTSGGSLMLACVEKVIAERDWGVILSVRGCRATG